MARTTTGMRARASPGPALQNEACNKFALTQGPERLEGQGTMGERTRCPFCGGLPWGAAGAMGKGRQGPPGVRALGHAWQGCRGAPGGPTGRPRALRARDPRGMQTWACRGAPPAPWTRLYPALGPGLCRPSSLWCVEQRRCRAESAHGRNRGAPVVGGRGCGGQGVQGPTRGRARLPQPSPRTCWLTACAVP